MSPRGPSHRVAVMAAPRMSLFELAIVVEVFALERPELDVDHWYAVQVFTPHDAGVAALGGMQLDVEAGVEAMAVADTVIVPSWPVDLEPSEEICRGIRAAYERGARVVSICSGAFVLAAAGLLDGRRTATHWRYADELARRYPRLQVDRDVLYVDDDRVLTSAGSAAGIDLSLHIIRKDHGAAIANAVARRLVVPPIREGGQAQYVEAPVARADDDRIQQLIEWVVEDPRRPVSVAAAAQRVNMSERTFSRHFKKVTGSTFYDWLTERRLHRSTELLETSDETIDVIAQRVGFTDPTAYRRQFKARFLTTPSGYRSAFRRVSTPATS
ncbi:helix-turn-helix domain-containing protein [Mumia sp. ZJ1417]|nr:helix-turn-helix domain-containing protein [Mumia sp. ZJ1417]QMW65273.1 helix-turn-helix domain-containing protein [Mumia sp. ZJ1417]